MSFEEDVLKAAKLTPQQFAKVCGDAMQTLAGRRLLTILCAARHPLSHMEGMTAHQHGNCEVVSLLWRYGSDQPTLPVEAETKTKPKQQTT